MKAHQHKNGRGGLRTISTSTEVEDEDPSAEVRKWRVENYQQGYGSRAASCSAVSTQLLQFEHVSKYTLQKSEKVIITVHVFHLDFITELLHCA
jgi:hypothetical protein